MRPQVIVVEGKNDKSRLNSVFPHIDVLMTNGSAIELSTIDILEKLDETHDIILFLDPDYAGDRIRRILSHKLNHVFHAFIDQKVSTSKNGKKVGVEHATDEDIKNALSHIRHTKKHEKSDITYSFLYDYQLIGHEKSKMLRMTLTKVFHIGYVNGKTLYQRLHMFGIKQKQIIEVLSESSS
jgi:ribonuclease M5